MFIHVYVSSIPGGQNNFRSQFGEDRRKLCSLKESLNLSDVRIVLEARLLKIQDVRVVCDFSGLELLTPLVQLPDRFWRTCMGIQIVFRSHFMKESGTLWNMRERTAFSIKSRSPFKVLPESLAHNLSLHV
jgi:hypothetical protein